MFKEKFNSFDSEKTDRSLVSINSDFININADRLGAQCDIKKIDIDNFKSEKNYRSELIDQDKKETDDMFSKFLEEAMTANTDGGVSFAQINLEKNLSIIQETMIAKLISDMQILGKGTDVSMASEFDDTFNHTDLIVEEDFNDKYENNITTFDVTFSKQNVVDKLDKLENMTRYINRPTKEKVRNYWELRYYKSNKKNESGQIDFSPKLVLGLSVKHILELHRSYMEKTNQKVVGDCLGLDNRFDYEFHPARIVLLEEMIGEAYYLKEIAKQNNNIRLAERYVHLYQALSNRLEGLKRSYQNSEIGKKALLATEAYKNDDLVYNNLLNKINEESEVCKLKKINFTADIN